MTFQEILEAEGVPFLTEGHHHCRPGWIQFDCPFCGKGSNKYHAGYSLTRKSVACWRCRGHSAISTLMELTGKGFRDIKKLYDSDELSVVARVQEKRGTLTLPSGMGDLLQAHRNYLEARRFDPVAVTKQWSLRGLGVLGRVKTPDDETIDLRWRIFIPINYEHKTVSWTTRTISERVSQRYISAPASCEEINHKTLLYGEDLVRGAVCCVEGPIDAWRIGPGCVATCGTAYSSGQVSRLARYPVRGICFDNEPDAQKRAGELVDQLSVFPGQTFNLVLDAKDAAVASDKEIAQVRRSLGL